MTPSGENNLTFLRGAGFLHNLVGAWDLIVDASGQWPSQRGFLIFRETKIIAVIERNQQLKRGIEGAYAVEGNRIKIIELTVDTAPEQGAVDEFVFEIADDVLTIKRPSTDQTRQTPTQVDRFQRRKLVDDAVLLPPVAIYEVDAPHANPPDR